MDIVAVEPLAMKVARLALIHAGEAAPKLRLVGGDGSLVIDENTTSADLIAAECTSTDYTAGGYAIVYVTGGVLDGETAYNHSPLLGFTVATLAPVNTIHGAWIDVGGTAMQRAAFPTPVPLSFVGAAIYMVVYDGYPPGVVGFEIVLP